MKKLFFCFRGVFVIFFSHYKKFSSIKKFKVIGSAHNVSEIKIKEKQNCEEIFLSPIFKTKKKKEYLETIQKKSQSSLFVILCDKLHSVSCMINDHNKIGKKLWKNHFQSTNDILWYYKTLCNKLKKSLKNHKTLKDRFQRNVNELEYKIKN